METYRAPSGPRSGRKTDWAGSDAANRKLGGQGEQFVFDLERHHLKEIGRADLAARVEWTARDRGDGVRRSWIAAVSVDMISPANTERLTRAGVPGRFGRNTRYSDNAERLPGGPDRDTPFLPSSWLDPCQSDA